MALIHINTPVVKLLLEHGANPRLGGVPGTPHAVGYPRKPVDETNGYSEIIARISVGERSSWYHAPHEVKSFEEANKLMKQAAEPYDGKHILHCMVQWK